MKNWRNLVCRIPSYTVADVDSKGGVDEVSRPHTGLTHGTLRTLAVSVSALRHFNFDGF